MSASLMLKGRGSALGGGVGCVRRGRLTWLQVVGLLLAAIPLWAAELPLPATEGLGSSVLNPEYMVEFWRTGEGLPHNTVNALLQTRSGYLWVGTAAGLARFDGLVFTLVSEETTPELREAWITALVEDHDGALWVGTQGRGVLRLGPGLGVQRFSTVEGLAHDTITSLALDEAGSVWIGTHAGLNRIEPGGRLSLFNSDPVPAGDGIMALHTGPSGKLWITTRTGVFFLQNGHATRFELEDAPQGRQAEFIGAHEDSLGNLWAFGATFLLNVNEGRRFNYFRSQELASSRVWTICEQKDGSLWIGTSGRGLFRFENGRFRVTGAAQGLEQCDVRALYADALGNVWIGTTDNGLARLRAPRVPFVNARRGVAEARVTSVAADPGGGLWVGTADAGLLFWDGTRLNPAAESGPLKRVTQVQSLAVDGAGALWVGTWGAGLWQGQGGRFRQFTTADGLGDDVVMAVAADPEGGGVWAGTQAGLLSRIREGRVETISPPAAPAGSAVLCLLPAPGGTVFGGTAGGQLFESDGRELRLLPVPAELAGKAIRALAFDHQQRLWVGSWGAGAFCRLEEGWIRLGRRQGLNSDFVGQIVQDDPGYFWFATADSLVKVRAVELESFLIRGGRGTISGSPGMADDVAGELSCATGWPGSARGTNGVLWLATSGGLLPLSVIGRAPVEPPPQVILESVLVNGQQRPVEPGQPLRLRTTTRSLDFVFTAINFTAPQKVKFRHKLEDFDVDWVQSELARRAHYGPLPPGRYRFRVMACNPDGVWSEATTTQGIIVVPPFWRTAWFLTLAGAGCVAIVWATARFISTRRLRARLRATQAQHATDRERARIAQDMHDEIGSKLTRISFLSEVARHAVDKPDEVGPPVEAIAGTSRELLQALDEIVWAVNPRNDNLEQLAGYLEQHAREYFENTAVHCHIQLPAELPQALLSAEVRHNVFLAFEEVLNNTLKHAGAAHVKVLMSLNGRHFEIVVEDDGKGFSPGAGALPEQDGLQNIQARLKAVGGTCEIASEPGHGTRVRMRFPLGRTPAGTRQAAADS